MRGEDAVLDCFTISFASIKLLRVTPPMEAGLTDHVWSPKELVELLERKVVGLAA